MSPPGWAGKAAAGIVTLWVGVVLSGVGAYAVWGSHPTGIGLMVTWPVMTWLAHRFARTPRGDRMLILVFGLPALYACVANTVDNVLSMVPDPDTESVLLAADLMYPLANQSANPQAAIVIALGLAAGVGIITFTPWHRRHRVAKRPGTAVTG